MNSAQIFQASMIIFGGISECRNLARPQLIDALSPEEASDPTFHVVEVTEPIPKLAMIPDLIFETCSKQIGFHFGRASGNLKEDLLQLTLRTWAEKTCLAPQCFAIRALELYDYEMSIRGSKQIKNSQSF